MSRVVLTPAAKRQLQKLSRPLQPLAAEIIRRLASDDQALDRKRLTDRPEVRVRSGSVRVFYVRDGSVLRITRIADRRTAYRD